MGNFDHCGSLKSKQIVSSPHNGLPDRETPHIAAKVFVPIFVA
jgi:hypothetical protein